MNSKNIRDKNSIVFLRQSCIVFAIFRLWKDSNHTNIKQRNAIGALVLLVFGFVLSACGFSGYFDSKVKGDDVAETHRALVLSIGVFLGSIKLYSMWSSVGEIKQCLGWMQAFSDRFDNQTFIKRALRLYRMFFTVGMFIITITGIFFLSLPLTANTRVFPLATKNPVQIVDLLQTPIYETIYFYQILSTIFLGACVVGCDTFFCGILLTIGAFFKTINSLFEETFLNGSEKNMNDEEKEKVMIRIIESYIETTRITNFVKDIFSLLTLGSLTYNMGIIGLALYLAASVPFDSVLFWCMVMTLLLQIFQLGIYCFFGEAILTQNTEFRCNIYQCDWYNQSKSFKIMILLTLQRTKNEPFIIAGKLVPLCNETFAEILKMAYSLCTFLYSFKEA